MSPRNSFKKNNIFTSNKIFIRRSIQCNSRTLLETALSYFTENLHSAVSKVMKNQLWCTLTQRFLGENIGLYLLRKLQIVND